MKVSDLQHHELFTAQADESLDVAADRMNWHQVGALPVLEGQRLVGIINERDLTAAWPRRGPGAHPGVGLHDPGPRGPPARQRARRCGASDAGLGIRHLPIVLAAGWSVSCRCATS